MMNFAIKTQRPPCRLPLLLLYAKFTLVAAFSARSASSSSFVGFTAQYFSPVPAPRDVRHKLNINAVVVK